MATGVAVVESGVITAINLTFAGSGYTSAPTITLSNTGSGAGFAADVRIDEFGQIAAINPTNVMRFLALILKWEHLRFLIYLLKRLLV